MKARRAFTPEQVYIAETHVRALYKNARSEYFTKQNINPHPEPDDEGDFFYGVATMWLNLKDFTEQEGVADWVIWSVGFAEAHADIWGPPLAVVKGEH